jgi:hypothetical protein
VTTTPPRSVPEPREPWPVRQVLWFGAGMAAFVFVFWIAVDVATITHNAEPMFLAAVAMVSGAWLERGRAR